MLGLGLAFLILVVVLIVVIARISRRKRQVMASTVFDVESQRLIKPETAKGNTGNLQIDETDSSYTGKKRCHPQMEIDSIVKNANGRSPMTTSRTSMGRQISQEETENDMEIVRHRNNDGRVDSSNSGGVDSSVNSGGVDSSVNSGGVDSSLNSGRVDSSNSDGVDSSVNSGSADSSVNSGGVDSSVNSGGVDSSENSGRNTRHETRNGSNVGLLEKTMLDLHNKLNTIPPCQDKEGKHAETVYS
ncbi:dentin sialophosphoprotein-like [Gigantopelta aegis]|uniref:dentin sialophosphoprotein-like n=1 Tax=Gigantopelta aegis TaxID=1735272 RepID=UPI001B887D5D|nr:dentin sialophosphoprotein-like [Gigantopelta aegis]